MVRHTFILSGEANSDGIKKDACLKCGRTAEWHRTFVKNTRIEIWFAGRLFVFANEEEAKKAGFIIQ